MAAHSYLYPPGVDVGETYRIAVYRECKGIWRAELRRPEGDMSAPQCLRVIGRWPRLRDLRDYCKATRGHLLMSTPTIRMPGFTC